MAAMDADREPGWEQVTDRVVATAQDAAAVAVGLGILGINRVQALRRDLMARLAEMGAAHHEDAESDGSDPAGR